MQGLGELYEEEYVKATSGAADAVEERDAATKEEARLLLRGLFARLDALSHFHFAPKPVVEDMKVRAEVPALAMEEVAPQVRFLQFLCYNNSAESVDCLLNRFGFLAVASGHCARWPLKLAPSMASVRLLYLLRGLR